MAALLFATTAAAIEPGATDRARLVPLLRAGANAAKAKQWDACIVALTAAASIDGAATTWGDLGVCEEAAGRFAAAHRHLSRALEKVTIAAGRQDPWKRYAAIHRAAATRIAIVILTVSPDNARVLVDGLPLGAMDGHYIPVEPGTHTFVARLEGYEDKIETRTLGADSVPTVNLVLAPKPRPAAAPAPVALPKPAPKSAPPAVAPRPAPVDEAAWYLPVATPRGVLLGLTYASTATLITSAATAIGLEVDRASLHHGLSDSACHPSLPAPPSQCAALHDRTSQFSTAVNLTIGTAIATAALAGVAGLVIAFDRSPASPKIAPSADANGGGIVVSGAW